jgi:hypothetical protein
MTTCAGARRRAPAQAGAWADDAGIALQPDTVRVFDAEPDLLVGVEPGQADLLRRRAIARKVWIEPGRWTTAHAGGTVAGMVGLLVIDGLMIRSVELDGRRCPEMIGAGDLLRPWDEPDGSVAHETSWDALERTSVAILDERFASIACRFPSIMVALMSRSVQRTRALALHLAIASVRHADVRLHMLFWHLADRWGRVTPQGVHLPLRLTHETLAELACMRRPTASTAVTELARAGELARRDDGTWLLTGSPPSRRR